jgi:hypothetical protein
MPKMVEYRFLRKATTEKLEKELTIRFLLDNLFFIESELQHLTEVKSGCQRLSEIHKLLRRVRGVTGEFKDTPRRNLSFYMRRVETIDKE